MQISTSRRVAFTAPVVATAPLPIAPEDVVLRPPLKRRPTFTPEIVDDPVVDSVETSCTESDCDLDQSIIASPPRRPRVPLSPVVPPRLVSLPSGGAISYMNSMDDVNALVSGDGSSPSHGTDTTIVDCIDDFADNEGAALDDDEDGDDDDDDNNDEGGDNVKDDDEGNDVGIDDSSSDNPDGVIDDINRHRNKVDENHDPNDVDHGDDEEQDDGRTPSARRLVRVDGSATLSAICEGEDDDDDDNDNNDDEFQIEGAEDVDEEEAVPVRSFGRSFARVCLGDGASATPAPANDSTSLSQIPHVDNVPSSTNHSSINENSNEAHLTPATVVETVADVANVTTCENDVGEVDFEADGGSLFDNAGGARRRSHFILPFPRRSSASTPRGTGPRQDGIDGDNDHAPTSIMCFRGRRSTGYARSNDAVSNDVTSNDEDGSTKLLTGQESMASRRRRRATNGSRTTNVSRTTNGRRTSKGYVRLSRGNRLVHAFSGRDTDTRARPPLPRRAPRSSGTSSRSRSRAGGSGRGKVSGRTHDRERERERDHEHEYMEKKIVRDVSLQQDDWIEFATSGGSQHRPHRWLARLVSSSGFDMSPRNLEEEDDESVERASSPYGVLPMRPSGKNGNGKTVGSSNETHFSDSSKSASKFWRRWTRNC